MRKYGKQIYMLIAIIACVGLRSNAGAEAKTEADFMSESDAQTDSRMEWWREARFGMFIHWKLQNPKAGKYNSVHGSHSHRRGRFDIGYQA